MQAGDVVLKSVGLAPSPAAFGATGFLPSRLGRVPTVTEFPVPDSAWNPAPHHVWRAASRLRVRLLNWSNEGSVEVNDETAIQRLVSDPAFRREVQDAAIHAACLLGLGTGRDVLATLDQMAAELACLEHQRERILGRLQHLIRRLAVPFYGSEPRPHLNAASREAGLLACKAVIAIRLRFDAMDAQTADIVSILCDPARMVWSIRSHRDGLARVSAPWVAMLDQWDRLGDGASDAAWALVTESVTCFGGPSTRDGIPPLS